MVFRIYLKTSQVTVRCFLALSPSIGPIRPIFHFAEMRMKGPLEKNKDIRNCDATTSGMQRIVSETDK